MQESHLVLGGARSGKSRHAVGLAQAAGGRVGFVATARGTDVDMRERIARHRAERPTAWITIEEPLDVVAACRRLAPRVDLVVVDCLTLWVSNLMERERGDDALLSRTDEIATLARERAVSLVLVSNEVGEGVHPETAIGVRFRDLLGTVNQRVAAAVDRVTLMVAGIPLAVKRVAPAPESVFHERTAEAP